MKKLTFILMAIFLIFAITACNFDDNEKKEKEDTNRKFWARNMKTDEFYQVSAEKLAENSRCIIWAEKGSNVTEATANNMANAYNHIYTIMMNAFGYEVSSNDLYDLFGVKGLPDMDTMQIAHYLATEKTSDAKLTILLLDIKDEYKPGVNDSFVAGFFDAVHLNKKQNNPKYPKLKYSNELDMIYVDTYPSKLGSDESNATLAHEMQHLMNLVTSAVNRYDEHTGEVPQMDLWINEGLSCAAEWLYKNGDPLKRVDWFNSNRGEIGLGNNFYVWGNRDKNPYANLDDYATAYLFFQYLRLQADEPDDIYFDIITSNYPDYRAVINAESINSNHKYKWERLLRDWFAANYMKNSSGLYGYKGAITVNPPMFPNDKGTVSLFPGEGVYSRINGSDSVPSFSDNSIIKYAGLNSSGDPITSGSAKGVRLTYNVNKIAAGSAVTGNTTGVASSVNISVPDGNASLQIAPNVFSGPYIVDAGYFLRKNQNYGMSDNVIRSVSVINDGEQAENPISLKLDRSKLKRVFINE